MTSIKQIHANRRNARKSTGSITQEGRQRSRCNAVRHGLTAETVIGALEDAEDYQAFETAVIADYKTGLFEIQANHLKEFRQARQALPASREVVYTLFGQVDSVSHNRNPASRDYAMEAVAALKPIGPAVDPSVELTRCFLRLANLPNFALDRLSRYRATLWRQARQILLALDALDRRKPQERAPFSYR